MIRQYIDNLSMAASRATHVFVVPVTAALLTLSQVLPVKHKTEEKPVIAPIGEINESVKKDLIAFMDSLAMRESNNTPTAVNRFGYMGKYQFGLRTLHGLGPEFRGITRNQFLSNGELQDSALVSYLRMNKQMLADLIINYDGRYINGIYITESGILAGAHLVGPHGVLAYFDSTYTIVRNGRSVRPKTIDGNGTSVEEYLKEFSGYSLTALE